MSQGGFDPGAVIDDARRVITNPITFYRHMPRGGGWREPVSFVALMGVITALIISALVSLGLAGAGGGTLLGTMVTAILFIPVMVLLVSFIFALFMHLIWRLAGSQRSFETSYRCIAYSAALLPLLAALITIPYASSTVRGVWLGGLLYFASTKVQKLEPLKAKMLCVLLASLLLTVGWLTEHRTRSLTQAAKATNNQATASPLLENATDAAEAVSDEADAAVDEMIKSLQKAARDAERD